MPLGNHLASHVASQSHGRPAVLQGLAFAMLKRTGKGGMAPFKGSGFITGRTVNARREAEWSAPTYFDMTIYGLGPPFRGDSMQHDRPHMGHQGWEPTDG